MNEIKGLLWYINAKLILLITGLFIIFGIELKFIIIMLIFAGFDTLAGILYYVGILGRKKKK